MKKITRVVIAILTVIITLIICNLVWTSMNIVLEIPVLNSEKVEFGEVLSLQDISTSYELYYDEINSNTFIDEEVNNYTNNLINSVRESTSTLNKVKKNEKAVLKQVIDTYKVNDDIVSVKITYIIKNVYEDGYKTNIKTFNYNLKEQKIITLDDMFKPEYKEKLSNLYSDNYLLKEKEIEFEEHYVINPITGEEIFDRIIEIENDLRLYDVYKKQVNLLTSVEIKAIRKKYEMNQKEFALAIGLGEITIHRFENGSIQTESVDSIIRLSEDPDIMYTFLIKNQSKFDEEEYLKFLKKINTLKNLKEHKIAQFNINELIHLDFKTEDALIVSNQLVKKYNSRVNQLSEKYNIKDICVDAEYITPLKLQKLLYFIQGLSAKVYGKRAFDNPIYAWSYGPVVTDMYKVYKGRSPILTPSDNIKISDGLNKIIDIVISSYGQIEAEKLIDLTHEEEPWLNTPKDHIIDFDLMKEYFEKVYEN